MMKATRLATFCLAISLLATAQTSALAAASSPPPSFESRETDDGRGTEAHIDTGPIISESDKKAAAVGYTDGKVWVGLAGLGSMENDEGEAVFCRRTRWVRVEPELSDQRQRDAEAGLLALFRALPELHGQDPTVDCPVDPAQAIPPVVLRDAIRHTIRDDLPRPALEIPPGYGVTGMPAYLVTNHQLEYGPVTHTVDLGIAVLQVTVRGAGSTHVDWGDGFSQTYHSPGTPWPEGQVVHTYRDARTVDITVTDTWQVNYTVPALGINDQVVAQLPARTLEGFEIQQVQAVRVKD